MALQECAALVSGLQLSQVQYAKHQSWRRGLLDYQGQCMTGEMTVVDFARCCWECCASLWVLLKGDWAPVVHRPRPISIRPLIGNLSW